MVTVLILPLCARATLRRAWGLVRMRRTATILNLTRAFTWARAILAATEFLTGSRTAVQVRMLGTRATTITLGAWTTVHVSGRRTMAVTLLTLARTSGRATRILSLRAWATIGIGAWALLGTGFKLVLTIGSLTATEFLCRATST